MVETIGTCDHCGGSVRLWIGAHPAPPRPAPDPATCASCGRTWPRLREWGQGHASQMSIADAAPDQATVA